MGIKVANNAFATLAAGITNSATSITVASGQGARFPSLGVGDYFYATLINTSNQLEIVKCTARSGDVLTVVRAQEATTTRAYDVGDRIEIRITAQTFVDATSDVENLNAGNIAYTGTLTGGTGVINIGSGQFYKDASGNVGIGTGLPTSKLHYVDGFLSFQSNAGNGFPRFTTNNGNIQIGLFRSGSNAGGGYIGASSEFSLDIRNESQVSMIRVAQNGSQQSVIPGGTTLYPEFKCRAWVNFNGTGTVAIRASGNVSSITDNGVGDYTVNFTTAMPDANYAVIATAGNGGGSTTNTPLSAKYTGTKSTTAAQVMFQQGANGADLDQNAVTIFR